ncbi:MAG: hypothetical protein H0X62_05765 [Bacteroidetes bacterium]|nr:hypothetical protein [Bacteroidota bacterium]
MPANFALPIGHNPTTVSSVNFNIDFPFRQPVDLTDKTDFSIGLDLWFQTSEPAKDIFSMFDGRIEYFPTIYALNLRYQNSLVLTIDDTAASFFKKIPKINEPIPSKIIYNNVNIAEVKASLKNLIAIAYNTQSSHKILNSTYKNKTIKKYIEDSPNQNQAIDEIVDDFSGTINFKLFTHAGDKIGAAGVKTHPAPFSPLTHNVNVIFELYDLTVLNPKYYLWHLLFDNKNNPQVRVNGITNVGNTNNTFTHPLLNSSGLNIDLNNPNDTTILPRIPVTNPSINNGDPTILFPVGVLEIFKGHHDKNYKENSKLVWKITNDNNLDFEVQLRDTNVSIVDGKTIRFCGTPFSSPSSMIDVCPDPNDTTGDTRYTFNEKIITGDINLPGNDPINVNKIAQYFDDISEICFKLQFPAEIIVAAIYHETKGNKKALRLEPVAANSNTANAWKSKINPTFVDHYTSTAPQSNLIVPDGVTTSSNQLVKTGKPLTWGELLQIINISAGKQMSPGLIQVLISTARWIVDDIIKQPLKDFIEANLQIIFPAKTATNIDYFNWLLNARNNIAFATVYHKYNYYYKDGKLDLIRQSSLYNSSGKTKTKSPWLTLFNDDNYPLEISKCFNYLQNNKGVTGLQLKAKFYKSF